MVSKIKTCILSLEANKQFPKSDKFSAKIFHMIAYFLFPGYTELFCALEKEKATIMIQITFLVVPTSTKVMQIIVEVY